MGAFAFSPGHCGASPCNCGACTGSLCVDLAAPCHATDNDGVTITVKDHSTGTVVGTATTDSAGHACLSLAPGAYDVTASGAAGCTTVSWLNQTLTCGGLNLTGDFSCTSGRTIRVFGCNSQPLPGATVTITGAGSATLTTDSSGYAYFFPAATGSYTGVVSHPSGRFKSTTFTWTQASLCAYSSVTFTLVAATGYSCCSFPGFSSVYPVSNTLYITDPGGTASFAASGCAGSLCVSRTMSAVSATDKQFVSCVPSGGSYVPPSDIASGTTAVNYMVTFGGSGATVSQTLTVNADFGGGGLHYHGAHATDGACSPLDTWRSWMIAQSCPIPGGTGYTFDSIGYTINSTYPLNVTVNFTSSGSGYGPGPTALTPTPYATSIVVSE